MSSTLTSETMPEGPLCRISLFSTEESDRATAFFLQVLTLLGLTPSLVAAMLKGRFSVATIASTARRIFIFSPAVKWRLCSALFSMRRASRA